MEKMKILETWTTGAENRYRKMAKAECPKCHKVVTRQYDNLKDQYTCGCQALSGPESASYKHGKEPKKLYNKWKAMRRRCFNPKDRFYKDYGGRGITVCDLWKESYVAFRDWSFKHGWEQGLDLDRKDNDGPYSPRNCRYVTKFENNTNQRDTKLNWDKVRKIRKMFRDGVPGTKIADKFDISSTYAYWIRDNKSWKE